MARHHPGLDNLIDNVAQLVSLPEVYYQLEQKLDDSRASMDDLARVLASDADLSARLLSVANSAFYGFPAKIESIARALAMVGIRQLRDLMLATSVVRLFSRLPLGTVSMNAFWRHSLFTGLVARCIAQTLREPNNERYYLAGLLHDIGRLVMYLRMPDLMYNLLVRSDNEQRLLYELEHEHIGFDHAAVGGALLESWRLPSSLSEPVACHHDPMAAAQYPLETAVIHLAGYLANREGEGTSGDRLIPHLSKQARARVKLSDAQLDTCLEAARQQYQEVAQVFLKN